MARANNNLVIKYDKFDWTLHLSNTCPRPWLGELEAAPDARGGGLYGRGLTQCTALIPCYTAPPPSLHQSLHNTALCPARTMDGITRGAAREASRQRILDSIRPPIEGPFDSPSMRHGSVASTLGANQVRRQH